MSPRRGFTELQDEFSGTAVIYARYSSHNQREVSIEQRSRSAEVLPNGTICAFVGDIQRQSWYLEKQIGSLTSNE